MENNFLLTDDLLWDYADGFLVGEEKLRVEAYLRQYPEQQARLDAIKSEKRAFSSLPLEKPMPGFANQVMGAWSAEQGLATDAAKSNGRDWILWGIGIAFVLMIAIPFLMAPSAAPTGFDLSVPKEYVPQLPAIDWAAFFNSAWLRNTLLLTLAFMGLKTLDKYLQLRRLHLS